MTADGERLGSNFCSGLLASEAAVERSPHAVLSEAAHAVLSMRIDSVSRRTAVLQTCLALSPWLSPAPATPAEPTAEQVLVAKRAFEAFDNRQLPLADELFTATIESWRGLGRGVEELTSLLVARAGVRVDRTDFAAAKADLDEAIELMAPTAEPAAAGGRARYREYPDAFVQRGLAREGLRDWQGALSDNVTRVRVRVRLASPSPSPGPDPKPLP